MTRRLLRRIGLLVLLAGAVQAVRRALRSSAPNDATAPAIGSTTPADSAVRAAPPTRPSTPAADEAGAAAPVTAP
ncbi:MAG TPA: hypothetical protein VJM49_16785, partial [Acidimicrobiales bacterium]|nr:hypothetical protein [Acidimicrobiales bacterium]